VISHDGDLVPCKVKGRPKIVPQRTRALDTGKFSITGVSSAGSLNDHRSRRSPRTRMCPCATAVAYICARLWTRGQRSGRPNATACRDRHAAIYRPRVPPSSVPTTVDGPTADGQATRTALPTATDVRPYGSPPTSDGRSAPSSVTPDDTFCGVSTPVRCCCSSTVL